MLLLTLLYRAPTNALGLTAYSDEPRAGVSGRYTARKALHAALAEMSGAGVASVFTRAMKLKPIHSAQGGLIEGMCVNPGLELKR